MSYVGIPSFINNFTKLLALYVLVDDDEIRLIVGINFLNGFLNLKSFVLKPHTPERFTTSTLPIHYNQFEELKVPYKKLLTVFCSNSALYLNHLRGFLKRAFILEPSFQTILLISGRPGSGKSIFINFLSTIFGNLLLAFDVREKNQFDRYSWIGKRILVLNDVNSLDSNLSAILKQLSGRDRIKYDIKNKQVNKDFIFEGILIIFSNHNADTLFTLLMDLALYDQVIEIQFDYVPKNRIRSLNQFLVKGASGLIRWALCCPDAILREQIRYTRGSITA